MRLFQKPTNKENAMVVQEKLSELEAKLEQLRQRVDTLERQIENEQQRQRGLHLVIDPKTMTLEPDADEVARERGIQSIHEQQQQQERREEAARRERAAAERLAAQPVIPGFG